MEELTAEYLRQHLGEVLDRVFFTGKQYVIKRRGKEMVAIVPLRAAKISCEEARESLLGMFAEAAQRGEDLTMPDAEVEKIAVEAVRRVRAARAKRRKG